MMDRRSRPSLRTCDFCKRKCPTNPALALYQCAVHQLDCPGRAVIPTGLNATTTSLQVCFPCRDVLGLTFGGGGMAPRVTRCPVLEPLDVGEQAATVLEWEARGWPR